MGIGAAALRLYHLGTHSLSVDEGFTLVYADTHSFAATLRLILETNGAERFSPLYPLLMHGVLAVLGNSEAALRSLSALCGIAAVVVVAAAGRSFFDRRSGILAGSLMAGSAFAIWYSQQARPYSLMLLLVSLQLWAFSRVLHAIREDGATTGRMPLAVISGVALFGSILFAISSFSLSLAHLLRTTDRRRWWQVWWPAGVASVPALAVYLVSPIAQSPGSAGVMSLQQDALLNLGYSIFGQLVGLSYGPPQVSLRGTDKMAVLGAYQPVLAAALVLGVVIVLTVVLARRLRISERASWSNWALLGTALAIGAGCAIIFVSLTRLNWQPRHAYFLFPVGLLVIAFAVSELRRSGPPLARVLAGATVIFFFALNTVSLLNYYTRPEYGQDDYRGAAAYLNAHRGPDGPSVMLGGMVELLRYYGDTRTIDLSVIPDSSVLYRMRSLARSGGSVLVAVNRPFYWWGGMDPNRAFGAEFDVRPLAKLRYFDFYRLQKKART